MKDYEALCISEYKKQKLLPKAFYVGKQKFLIPLSYQDNIDAFIDELLVFQDNEYKKYEQYNKKNQTNLQPEMIKIGSLNIIRPLNHAVSNCNQEKTIDYVAKKISKKLDVAAKRTIRAKKQYPNQQFNLLVNKKHLNHLSFLHRKYCADVACRNIKKAAKATGKQGLNIAVGSLGALPAVAYFLLDKKYKFANNKAHGFIKKSAMPYVKKGAIKAMLTLGLSTLSVGAVKELNKSADNSDSHDKKEVVIKDAVFAKNYQTAKENEAEIFALLACSEDFRSEAYLCPAKKWTIGYGSTMLPGGVPVKKGMTINKEDAYESFISHLEKCVYPAFEHIKKELNPSQIAAVCGFLYNNGADSFEKSHLCKTINKSDSDREVREAFSMYRSITVNGKKIRSYGLINANGYRGKAYECGLRDFLVLHKNHYGNKDVSYFKKPANKRDPYENKDGSFILEDDVIINANLSKFKTANIEDTVLGTLPQNVQEVLIERHGIEVVDGVLECTKKHKPKKTINLLSFLDKKTLAK